MRDRPIPHAHQPKPQPKINYPTQNDQPNSRGGSRLSKKASVSRVYLPPDANTLLVTLRRCLDGR